MPRCCRRLGDRKLLKFANRSHRFALVAAAQAFADAGIRPTEATATRWGCVVGTGMMGVTYDELAQVQQDAAAKRRARARPAARTREDRPPTRWSSAAATRPAARRC